jgi:Golgi apparatus protein 1
VCGGTVLRCLTDQREAIASEACGKEVMYFTKMEVSNYHNDVILAAQCRADVDKHCKDVQPGALCVFVVCVCVCVCVCLCACARPC